MSSILVENKDDLIMRLVHYFITEEHYTPIIVNGVNNEIWLENVGAEIGIIRINSNYIHNNEQLQIDVLKTKSVMKQIKKKTLAFKLNSLNIQLNLNEGIKVFQEDTVEIANIKKIEDIDQNQSILEKFPNIKSKLIKDLQGVDLIMNVTKEINEKTEKNNKEYEKVFKKKTLLFTPIIIALCSIMFVVSLLTGALDDVYKLLDLGAVYGPYIADGQIYRLITGAFLHGSITHILLNMYALFIIGSQVETYFGKAKFVFIYLISAVSGSLLSIILSDSVSVGASGAIFGLLGALAYFGYYHRVYLGTVLKSQIIPLILLNVAIGFLVPGIDNAAHIGGLIGGFLATMAIGLGSSDNKNNRIHGKIVLFLYLAFLLYVTFFIKY